MPDVASRLEELRSEAEAAIAQASDPAALEDLRVRYLGRKSELTTVLRGIRDLPPEQRGPVGKAANEARMTLEEVLDLRREALESGDLEERLAAGRIDVTPPGGPPRPVGPPPAPPPGAGPPRGKKRGGGGRRGLFPRGPVLWGGGRRGGVFHHNHRR